jgi:anti-anti-sigma factor
MPDSMFKPTLQTHNENGLLVAEFWNCHRLDPQPVKELRSKYEAHLRAKGRPVVVIDLLGVGFAGSAALSHFVSLHRVASPNGGQLVFCNVDPMVFEVFRVSKLDPLFSFSSDRAKALELAEALSQNDAKEAPADPGGAAPVPGSGPLPKSSGNRLRRSNLRRKLS